jgi:dTDP-glucose 4,6-dehydratase/GDP-L-fucose synthase
MNGLTNNKPLDLAHKSIIVTGGAGFVGSSVVDKLHERGCDDIFVPRSAQYDLRDASDVQRLFEDINPDVVIHLAGTVGGIGMMEERQGEIFYDNVKMALELQEMARKISTEKFVSLGSVCAYPKHTSIPFKESDLWDGYPEETHAPYGIAKKIPLVQSKAYRRQYNLSSIYLLPVNLYGPGDDFDPKTSHVIPAIIRKVDSAIENDLSSITAWGTGDPTREFLHVDDAAEAIVEATRLYDDPRPVNIGASGEISIRELVNMIADLMGFNGKINWDTSRPDGQPRRKVDTSRAEEMFGWTADIGFKSGLKETIEWYSNNKHEIVTSTAQ